MDDRDEWMSDYFLLWIARGADPKQDFSGIWALPGNNIYLLSYLFIIMVDKISGRRLHPLILASLVHKIIEIRMNQNDIRSKIIEIRMNQNDIRSIEMSRDSEC